MKRGQTTTTFQFLKALPSCLEVGSPTCLGHQAQPHQILCQVQVHHTSEKAEGQGRNGRGAEDKMNYFLQGPDDWEESVAQKGDIQTGLQVFYFPPWTKLDAEITL